jgi:hypothetical protein
MYCHLAPHHGEQIAVYNNSRTLINSDAQQVSCHPKSRNRYLLSSLGCYAVHIHRGMVVAGFDSSKNLIFSYFDEFRLRSLTCGRFMRVQINHKKENRFVVQDNVWQWIAESTHGKSELFVACIED